MAARSSSTLPSNRYGAVLVLPPLVPGEVLLEPMLLEPMLLGPMLLEPMLLPEADGLAPEFWAVAEGSEPLAGSEGAVAVLLLLAEPLLGLVALLAPMLGELPTLEPLPLESWAKAAGAKAATDIARPVPSK